MFGFIRLTKFEFWSAVITTFFVGGIIGFAVCYFTQ